ncbi:MAG: cytochrome c [Planctomycetota bacterium]
MNSKPVLILILLASFGLLALSFAILGFTRKEPPLHVIHNMDAMPRWNSQSPSTMTADGRSMRHPPAHTVASGYLKEDDAFFRGLDDKGEPIARIPMKVDEVLLARGRDRYEITCSPCHDRTGSGKGLVVRRGLVAPPSFRDERLKSAPDGELYQVITHGVRTMPAYAAHLDEADRWAVVAYIRALQMLEGDVEAAK